jgi:DNA-directed RNA polymerase specialized sigma24 family protein
MYREAAVEDLSRSQFDAAHRAFITLLRRKRMSPQFIERHGEDLFAQAGFEYSRQLAEGNEIANPVAWLVTCSWHRTVSLLESQDWKPKLVSTESVGELSAVSAPSPEDALLTEDRYRKIREAVEELPEYQRQLLALAYFADGSVRKAARGLRWTPSKGQRAHEAAQRRLHKLLGVESSDELEIELIAFLSLAGGGGPQLDRLLRAIEGVSEPSVQGVAGLGHQLVDLVRRPFGAGGDPGSSTAVAGPVGHVRELGRRFLTGGGADATTVITGGGDRAAELCKAVAVCLIGGGAITGALLGGGHHGGRLASDPPPPPAAQVDSQSHFTSTPATEQPTRIPVPDPSAQQHSAAGSAKTDSGAEPSPAARRAQKRKKEASSAEDEFSAFAKAAAEAESPTTTGSASSSSTAESAPVESSPAPAESPQQQSESQQVHDQFRGGLP